jgi:hypothetical protein
MLKQQLSQCTVKTVGLDFQAFPEFLEGRNLGSGQHEGALSLLARLSRH